MRRLALTSLVLLLLAGCAARPAPKPAVPSGPPVATASPLTPFALPVAVSGDRPPDPTPLSIQRLVREQRSEMQDVTTLAGPVGDARGRARAALEVSALADELREIEAALRAGEVASDRLDQVVVKLQRLATRIAILHDALRVASGPPTAVQVD